jgi:hypothetical protein
MIGHYQEKTVARVDGGYLCPKIPISSNQTQVYDRFAVCRDGEILLYSHSAVEIHHKVIDIVSLVEYVYIIERSTNYLTPGLILSCG